GTGGGDSGLVDLVKNTIDIVGRRCSRVPAFDRALSTNEQYSFFCSCVSIAPEPPNHPDFRVTLDQNVPCADGNERVQLNGTLQLHFETINGVARPRQMAARRLEDTGTGLSTHRTYVAISTPIDSDVDNVRKVLGETHGHWTLKFKVVANPNPPGQADSCPGCVFQFTLKYSIH